MNVLLINPRSNRIHSKVSGYFPLGLAYIASYLQQNSFNVRVLDFQAVSHKADGNVLLQKEIRSFNPEIVGIGCLFSVYFPNLKEIAGEIKRSNPEILIVIGGLHPTIFYRNILINIKYIDFVLLGEAEESFLRLCLELKNGSKGFNYIDGLAYRDNGRIIINEKKSFIECLDNLPFPAFNKFDMRKYFSHFRYNKKNRGISIITSRSCPNRCSFCSMFHSHGTRWRPRGAKNVLDEMEFLYETYRIRHFQFMDDNMTFDKARTIDIFKGIEKRGLRITFDFPNGLSVNTLDREVIAAMKKAGCAELRLAIESGSEYMRNTIIKKRLSDKKIFEVVEICNEFKMPTIAFFVLGMPGEDFKTVSENINFVKKLKGRWFVDFISPNFATPFPGTELFDQCIEEKLIDDKTINSIVEGTISLFDRPVIKLNTLSERELIGLRNNLWKVTFRQNFLQLLVRYFKPSLTNYRIITAFFRRFFLGY